MTSFRMSQRNVILSDLPRVAEVVRTTRETDIRLKLDLDGQGRAEIATGVGFLDHMLELLARHSLVNLTEIGRAHV